MKITSSLAVLTATVRRERRVGQFCELLIYWTCVQGVSYRFWWPFKQDDATNATCFSNSTFSQPYSWLVLWQSAPFSQVGKLSFEFTNVICAIHETCCMLSKMVFMHPVGVNTVEHKGWAIDPVVHTFRAIRCKEFKPFHNRDCMYNLSWGVK